MNGSEKKFVKKISKIDNNKYCIYDNSNNIINEFEITQRTIQNKFNNIIDFLKDVVFNDVNISSKLYDIISNWTSYEKEKYILDDFEKLFQLCDSSFEEYIKENIKPENFSKKNKSTKKSMLIEPNDITSLIKLSGILKIYVLFFYTTNNIYSKELKNKVYNNILKLNNFNNCISVIYKLIEKKLSTFKGTDKNMWLFIKLYHNKDFGSILNETFNFIITYILCIYEIKNNKNIISFIVSYTESNIMWLFSDVYQNNIVLIDSLNEENGKNDAAAYLSENLKSDFIQQYSYENTLNYINSITKKYFISRNIDPLLFEVRTNDFFVTPLQKYFVLPVISRITNIEYRFLLNKTKYQIYMLQVYLYYSMSETLFKKYKNAITFLKYGLNKNVGNTTSIKLKKSLDVLQKTNFIFYNIKNKSILVKLMTILSSMTTRSNKLVNIFVDTLNISPGTEYINDFISFFIDFFNNEKNEDIEILRKDLIARIKEEKENK